MHIDNLICDSTKAVDILSLDAKDLYLSNHLVTTNQRGYSYIRKDGSRNTRKFINKLDYSLDLIKLREIYSKVTGRKRGFSFFENEHEYCPHVINVTFNYSVKTYNQVMRNFYVKAGFTANVSDLTDGTIIVDGELIAIQLLQPVHSPVSSSILGKHFVYSEDEQCYLQKGNLKTIQTRDELRYELYRNGFYCEGIHYVRYKRSSGSARVGKCLFVNEILLPKLRKYDLCGLSIKDGQEIDLAALESYMALTSSSIIDIIKINPENILVIDDYNSVFTDRAIVTSEKGGHLISQLGNPEMSNSIWDGLSLIDKSLMGPYSKKGMLLLRNNYFKTCGFNSNIQKWLSDNGITSVDQLHGFTLAKNIEDIKLITTPSSIKYLKFGTLEQWFKNIDSVFGIVKYDKQTHFLGGRLVQTHYQLINTLQLSKDDIKQFLKPSLDFRKQLREDPAVLRHFIKYPVKRHMSREPLVTNNEIVFNLMGLNDNIVNTKYYRNFQNDLIRSFTKNLKCGHVLVNGNYSTLLGNPIEMLQAAIGTFNGESVIGIGNIHSTRFEYDKTLIASRSPHVTASCVWLPRNTANELIDTYINLTQQVVCINSIGEPTLSRLSGADFDSDTILLTDNEILINAAKKNYDRFAVSVCDVSSTKVKRYYTDDQKADLDIKTSVNKIGEIVNLSQVLNSMYWDNIYHGQSHEDNFELFCDICTLNVCSGLAIDSAKKEFSIDCSKELQMIRNKYKEVLTEDDSGNLIRPKFFMHILRASGKAQFLNTKNKSYLKHETPMDYLQEVASVYYRPKNKLKDPLPIGSMLDRSQYSEHNVYKPSIHKTLDIVKSYRKELELISKLNNKESGELNELRANARNKRNLELDQVKYSYSTMYKLLWLTDKEVANGFSDMLISTLFSIRHRDFYNILIQSEQPIAALIADPLGEIEVYGYRFRKEYI